MAERSPHDLRLSMVALIDVTYWLAANVWPGVDACPRKSKCSLWDCLRAQKTGVGRMPRLRPRAVEPEQKDLIDKNLGPSGPELEQKTKSNDRASLRRASMMD